MLEIEVQLSRVGGNAPRVHYAERTCSHAAVEPPTRPVAPRDHGVRTTHGPLPVRGRRRPRARSGRHLRGHVPSHGGPALHRRLHHRGPQHPETVKARIYTRYRATRKPGVCCEVDHLIPLELGGSNAVTNLWPEPYSPKAGAREKDVLENFLPRAVCGGADAHGGRATADCHGLVQSVPGVEGNSALSGETWTRTAGHPSNRVCASNSAACGITPRIPTLSALERLALLRDRAARIRETWRELKAGDVWTI
jgi:hypothetical protein